MWNYKRLWGINGRIWDFWCFSHFFHLFKFASGIDWQKYLIKCIYFCFSVFVFAEELEEEKENPTDTELTEKQKHQLRHRELFLSRQYESLPATHIRYSARGHVHKMDHTARHLKAVPMGSQSLSHERIHQALLTSFCLCFIWYVLPPPTLFPLGGSAVSHYWMRLKPFFHTLTKR